MAHASCLRGTTCASFVVMIAAAANEVEVAGGRALPIVADVSRYDDVTHFVDAATEVVIEVDLLGGMHGCRAVVPHFRTRRGATTSRKMLPPPSFVHGHS